LHWHIEGWCAVKENLYGISLKLWDASDGPCQYLGIEQQDATHIFASTLNAMRDRIR
jgi:hypothetical protein